MQTSLIESMNTQPDIKEKVYLARVNMFFGHAAGNIVASLVGGVLIGTLIHFTGTSRVVIAAWYASLCIACGVTYFVDRRFSQSQLNTTNARSWLIRRIFAGCLIGLTYGISPLLMAPGAAFEAELLLFIMLSTLVSIASVGYAVMPAYYLTLNVVVLWPITISFFSTLDIYHIVMIITSVMWQFLVLSKVSAVSRSTIEALYTNERLQHEIGERMKAEEALRESEERFKTLSTASFEGILITRGGKIIDANRQFEEMSGYSRKELIDRNVLEMVLPEHVDLVEKKIATEYAHPYEIIAIKKNREQIILEVRGKNLSYKGDNIRVSAIRDITKKKQIEKELETLASTDTLTGLDNRRSGILFLEKQIHLARRKGFTLTVCFIDVDGLKAINDIYGHDLGDDLIKSSGMVLLSTLRDSDLVCRLGGDEFLVIFPDCNIEQASELWNRITAELQRFNSTSDKSFQISFSHGFAEFVPPSNLSADELISMADSEMYKEKKAKKTMNGHP
jgi:diguanylate cyclase (GGDEF)-like protein/PAS domain S-box-containing protein